MRTPHFQRTLIHPRLQVCTCDALTYVEREEPQKDEEPQDELEVLLRQEVVGGGAGDVEIDELPADVQPVYRRFAEEYGPFLNQLRVFAHRPAVVRHIQGLLLDLADEHDFVVASDECYLEFGWDTEPVSILHPDVCDGSHEGLLAVHSLSKRSNLAGILGYETRPLVSADFVNETRSAVVDAPSTMVVDGTLVKGGRAGRSNQLDLPSPAQYEKSSGGFPLSSVVMIMLLKAS